MRVSTLQLRVVSPPIFDPDSWLRTQRRKKLGSEGMAALSASVDGGIAMRRDESGAESRFGEPVWR